MHLFNRVFFSGALALFSVSLAAGGRAAAAPPADKPAASAAKPAAAAAAPVIDDKDIYFSPKTLDLEFGMPGEYAQVSVDDANAHGDTFEAFGPADKNEFRPHIELIRFEGLPRNAVVNKDLIQQMAAQMGRKVNDYKLVQQGEVTVAGKPVPFASSTFRFRPDKKVKNLDTNLLVRNKQVFFIHKAGGKDIGFMFVFTADAARYDRQVEAFDHLIGTISFPSAAGAAAPAAK